MKTSRTIAITGATGLIGGALCRHLAGRGYAVRALTRRPAPELGAVEGVRRFVCDLPGGIEPAALRGCDALIHAAYATRFRTLAEARQTNEEGTLRLLNASRAAGVPRFIFVSSTSAHPQARSYYGRSKFRLESELEPARDLVVRPGLVLAPTGGLFQRVVTAVKRTGVVPLFGNGRQPVQTVHIEDLCLGFQRALEKDLVGSLTIAEPRGVIFRELFRLVAERLGRRVRFVPIPIGPALLGLKLLEALRLPLPVSSENLLGLLSLRHVECREDAASLGITVRSAEESLRAFSINSY